MKPFIRRLSEARFLSASFVIHLGLIILLGGVVLFKASQPPETFVSNSGFIQPGEEIPEDLGDSNLEQEFEAAPAEAAPAVSESSASALTTLANANLSISSPVNLVQPSAGSTLNPNLTATATTTSRQSGNIGGALGSRSAGERARRLQAGGGKKEADEAVLRGLRWLQKAQHANGTWGQKYVGAMSGLALLAFLGHGETPRNSVEFGGTVEKAIDAITEQGLKAKGYLAFQSGHESVYQHAIATYALCEAYAMTKDGRISGALEPAIELILKGQRPDGGWAYEFNQAPDTSGNILSDTSISGWMIQALKTAKLADLHNPGIVPALEQALKNIERVYNPANGSFGYRRAGDKGPGAFTGVGVLSIYFIEGKGNKMTREGLDAIFTLPKVDYKGNDANFYAWYYFTQACFQAQGSAWQRWNHMFQDELINNQSPDGSWPPHGGVEISAGTGLNLQGPDPDVYRTALCVLMLEVYYRYSPVSQLVPR